MRTPNYPYLSDFHLDGNSTHAILPEGYQADQQSTPTERWDGARARLTDYHQIVVQMEI